jgi:hypothetical protein
MMPLDAKRMRIRQAAEMGQVEQEVLPNEEGAVPADDSWRYRRTGFPRGFALLGVVVGFAALIVPGLFALRSYRHWQDGEKSEPTLAWSLAVLGLIAIPLVPLFTVLPIVAVVLAFIIGLPLLVLVGPRH